MRSLLFAAVSLAYVSAGCAVIAAKAPDPGLPRDQPPMCNDGKGGVAVDGLMATAFGIGTLAAASGGEGEAAAITGLIGIIYGISAGVGNSSANKCRAAMEDYVAYREREKAETAFARQTGAPSALGGIPTVPEEEDEETAPRVASPRPQPQPQPQPQAQPQPQPPAKSPPAKSPPASESGSDDGEWSEFWKEVP